MIGRLANNVAVLKALHHARLQAFRPPERMSSTNDFCLCPSTCHSLQSIFTYIYALSPITIIYLSRILSSDETPIFLPKLGFGLGVAPSSGKYLLKYSLADWSTLLCIMTLCEFLWRINSAIQRQKLCCAGGICRFFGAGHIETILGHGDLSAGRGQYEFIIAHYSWLLSIISCVFTVLLVITYY